jgi:diaminopimelate epimerase
MRIQFEKMNGAGNDFVLVDNRKGDVRFSAWAIRWLCDRRRGVGADGVILVERDAESDFRMRYYNSDGGEADMCGNGARCVARFARGLGLGRKQGNRTTLRFATNPGPMTAAVDGTSVTLTMIDASGLERSISLQVADHNEKMHVIHTGVPHVVLEETDVDVIPNEAILARGRAIRTHGRFAPQGTNVNFISMRADGAVKIRTYERGVEGETLACGTGAVAGAVVAAHLGRAKSPVVMATRGGELLKVSFEAVSGGATGVLLEGPATLNFVGSVEVPNQRSVHGD